MLNYFINLVNGHVSVNTYARPNTLYTNAADVLSAAVNETGENLSASFAPADLCAHPQAYDFLNIFAFRTHGAHEGTVMFYELGDFDFVALPDNTIVLASDYYSGD